MTLVFETRFSFFGHSGWRSPASRDAGMLFDPDRLTRRFDLFEKITLASLRDQSDPDFKHVVLSSMGMPNRFKRRLRDMCNDMLGAGRAQVIFRGCRSAGKMFRRHITTTLADETHVTQVVLDDDDAVSFDFVERCKTEARHLRRQALEDGSREQFLSFSRGLTLGVENGALAWLSPRFVPFTNLGLALIAPPDTLKSLFTTSHRKIGERHSSIVINSLRPFYLRAVHEQNDSRAIHSKDRIPHCEIQNLYRYFPFLADHFERRLKIAAQ